MTDHPLWPAFVRRIQESRHHPYIVGHVRAFVGTDAAASHLLVKPWASVVRFASAAGEADEAAPDPTVRHPCRTLPEAHTLQQQGARHGGSWVCVDTAVVWETFIWHVPLSIGVRSVVLPPAIERPLQPWPCLAALRQTVGEGVTVQLMAGEAEQLLGASVTLACPLPEAMEQYALQWLLQEPLPDMRPALPALAEAPAASEALAVRAHVTVLCHGRQRQYEEVHQALRDLRCHAAVRCHHPDLQPTATARAGARGKDLPPYPSTPALLAQAVRHAPQCQPYLEALACSVPNVQDYPADLRPAVEACRQQLREVEQDAQIREQLQMPPQLLACLNCLDSVPALPAGSLRVSTAELYPPLSAPYVWKTLSEWLRQQTATPPVLLLMLYMSQRHLPGSCERQKCLALVHRVMGSAAAAAFLLPGERDQSWQDLCPDTSDIRARIHSLLPQLLVQLQQRGILYLIRQQQPDESPCCHPAELDLTLEVEEGAPPPPLPSPPPAALAPFLPAFANMPDDTTLVYTQQGFTVARLNGLAGGEMQALWAYVHSELQKVRQVAPANLPEYPLAPSRSAATELMQIYDKEGRRLQQLVRMQQSADGQLERLCLAFMEAFHKYHKTSTKLRRKQEILEKLHEAYILQPEEPRVCSALLPLLQRKLQWTRWFGQQGGRLTALPYPSPAPALQRWYTQAMMCQISDESQFSRTVTTHPDGTTVSCESHSRRRTAQLLQWTMQILPQLLQVSDDSEQHYQEHQFRIDWIEYLLRSLHHTHQLVEEELHAVKHLIRYDA